jgi:hypothetical protein
LALQRHGLQTCRLMPVYETHRVRRPLGARPKIAP